jgi:hypothetical protein
LLSEDGSAKQDTCLVGVVSLLADLSQLLVPSASDDKPKTKIILTKPNLIDHLSSTRPIQYKSRDVSRKRTQEQRERLKKMEQALEEGDAIIARVEDVALRGKNKAEKGKASGSKSSFMLVEKSLAVRVALTELQKSFDCLTGVDHVLGEGSGSQERVDYLRSLVHHVDTLATLILYWQTKPDGKYYQVYTLETP